ncbi:hypothetical protein [Pantoea allii]|uniref:hypothetical protein n=1 Tax=Pantoea allii TaxID=574096 RepID=UPI0024B85EDE|nr:hypothetical protein [Pantoea allii]MDJ0042940.1 hypothetical protein [Pantoea allii]
MTGLKVLIEHLHALRKQMPFALTQALTSVAREIAAAEKTALARHLASPTPFTVNAVGSTGARKNNLQAKVFVRDIAASYLEPFEFGGQHKLNSNALLNPKNIKLNKYGNLPRNKLSHLKAKDNVFIGEVGSRNGVFQRVKSKKGKKAKKRLKRLANGTRRERDKSPAPKLLIQFGNALPVKPVLGYMDRAEKMAGTLMQAALSAAISQALRTAK